MNSYINKVAKIVAAVLALLLFVQVPLASAQSISELKNQKSQIDKKKSQLEDKIQNKSKEINTIQSNQQKLETQIKQIVNKISETSNQINDVNIKILNKNKEIKKIQADIKELQEKIQQRDELLKERARAIQVNGEVSYIDVVLGAESFVDFIDRFSAVNTIIDADRQIMKDQKEDKRKLEEDEYELQKAKKELENTKTKLNQLKNSLSAQEKEKSGLINELEKEAKNLTTEKAALQAELEDTVKLSAAMNAKIAEAQRKYLEELRKREQQNQQSNGGSSGSQVSSGVSRGAWTNPAPGRITSPFGYRIHPVYKTKKFHYGVDIAQRGASVPIYAAANGIVVHTGYLGGYGNVVIITHHLSGQTYTTVYAHLKGYSVGVGQTVAKGQRIATMGSTGVSTGQHLHFEVHTGTWRGQKAGAQNPLNYIPGY